jgi:hypothetical protein
MYRNRARSDTRLFYIGNIFVPLEKFLLPRHYTRSSIVFRSQKFRGAKIKMSAQINGIAQFIEQCFPWHISGDGERRPAVR